MTDYTGRRVIVEKADMDALIRAVRSDREKIGLGGPIKPKEAVAIAIRCYLSEWRTFNPGKNHL